MCPTKAKCNLHLFGHQLFFPFLLLLATSQFWMTNGLKILFIAPKQAESQSHFSFAKSIAEVWRTKHEVHLLVPILENSQRMDEATNKQLNVIYHEISDPELLQVFSNSQDQEKQMDNWYKPYYDIINDDGLMAKLAAQNFDVGIAEMMFTAQYAFAVFHALKIPTIMKMKNYTLNAQQLYDLGAVDPMLADGIPAVNKARLNDHDPERRKQNREENRKIYFENVKKRHSGWKKWDKHFDALPAFKNNPFPGLLEMYKQLQYLLVNSTPETEFDGGKALEQFEKVHLIGGVALKDKLDERLEETAINREIKKKAHGKKGILLASFGTLAKMIIKRLGDSKFELFSKALLENEHLKDYLIVVQLPKEHPDLAKLVEKSKYMPNLYANSWLDIQSLLAYKGDAAAGIAPMSGFITHCARNSQIEAYYHGVPLICLPMAYDQMYNAESAAQKQLAIVFDLNQPSSFSQANLEGAFRELVELYNNPSASYSRRKTEEMKRLNLANIKAISETMQRKPRAKKMLMDLIDSIEQENISRKGKFMHSLPRPDYHAHPIPIDFITMSNGPVEILGINQRKLHGGNKFQLEITGSIRKEEDADVDFRIVPMSLGVPCSDKPSYPESDQVGWLSTTFDDEMENVAAETFPLFLYNYNENDDEIGRAKYEDYIMNGFKMCIYRDGTTLVQELEMKRFKMEGKDNKQKMTNGASSSMSLHITEKLHYARH